MGSSPPGVWKSTVGLVLANAVPLVGVVFFGWGLHSLLVAYWLESGAIGATTVAKIYRSEGEDDPEELPSTEFNGRSAASFVGESNSHVARFFVGHYGTFWVVHGMFVFPFALIPELKPASPGVVAAAAVSLAVYHAVSYRVNYVGDREYEHTGPVTLMIEPYRRTLVLHVTIIFGALLLGMVNSPLGLVAVLVLTKTLLDLRGHWKEHDRARQRRPPANPTE